MLESFYSKNYFRFGFSSRLYEVLMPEAYRQSLRKTADSLPSEPCGVWLDVGCGPGGLLGVLRHRLDARKRYIGLEVLQSAVAKGKKNARGWGCSERALFARSDVRQGLPLKNRSVAGVADHFTLYMLTSREHRMSVLSEYRRVLAANGRLVCVCPSKDYNAHRIVAESLEMLKGKVPAWLFWLKRWILYPLALQLGLRFVEKTIRSGERQGFDRDELLKEIEACGFEICDARVVYGASAFWITARRIPECDAPLPEELHSEGP